MAQAPPCEFCGCALDGGLRRFDHRTYRRFSFEHCGGSARKILYERLINVTDDPGVKEALGFLMTREIAHQQAFEKALHSIQPNFPQGKLPGMPEFTNKYFNMSGEPNVRGPWNEGGAWEYVENPAPAVDGGDGLATVSLPAEDIEVLEAMKARTASDPLSEPLTGADLGSGYVQGKYA